MKHFKKIMNEKELVLGLSVWHICSPWIAKVYSDAGADFIFVDTEHIFFNGADLANLISSCFHLGLPVVAKCPYMDKGSITRLLDSGISSIQLPMTESAEQMNQLVSWIKFPPAGLRAAGPGIGNSNYQSVNCKSWIEETNNNISSIAHIETKAGIEKVEEILEIPEVDFVYVGMLDLSISYGYPEQYDNSEIVSAVDNLINLAKRYDKPIGMPVNSYEMAKPWIKKGVRFFEMMSEGHFIAQGANELLDCFR